MSYFEINGLAVSTEKISEARDIVIGAMGRSASGAGLSPDGKVKRSLDATLGLMSLATAQAYAGLLSGRGQHFSFDSSLYSSSGLGPNSGYTATLSTTKKFGDRSCYTMSRTATWQLDELSSYSISAWAYDGTWHHIAVIDGTTYKDGSPSSFTDVVYSSGALTLTASSFSRVDDLVIYPGAMPIATLQAMHAQAFSDLPQVLLGGDFINGDEATFIPSAVKVEPVKGQSLARVSARFDEV